MADGLDRTFFAVRYDCTFLRALGWKENRKRGGVIHPAKARMLPPRGILRETKYSQYRSRRSKPTVQRLRKPIGGWFFWGVPYSTPRVASASEGLRGSTEGMRGRAAWLSWSGDLRNRLTIHQSKAIARSNAIRA